MLKSRTIYKTANGPSVTNQIQLTMDRQTADKLIAVCGAFADHDLREIAQELNRLKGYIPSPYMTADVPPLKLIQK